MIYDLIIIGAGAAGLFAGASLSSPVRGLIIEKKTTPGRKLLMTGAGQCNLTHGGSIKDFISHYGKNGPLIRSVLYRFSNQSVIDFFESRRIPLFQRDDEKIFPKSLQAQDILDALTEACIGNGLEFIYASPVERITANNDTPAHNSSLTVGQASDSDVYTVFCGNLSYQTKKLIIATGGCSYPGTGSDGSFFTVLMELGIEIVSMAPALVPIFVRDYPYGSLSGISFRNAEITVFSPKSSAGNEKPALISKKNRDALLLTHNCFSGPAILNLSRFAHPGDTVAVSYFPSKSEETACRELYQFMTGNPRQLLTVLYEYFNPDSKELSAELPKRFLETVCSRSGINWAEKASRISPAQLKSVVRLILHDEYIIQKLGGYESAMVTAGGVALSEINIKTMESKKYPNLFFAGEVLDVDGDTGGYNLQFAFSSGCMAARNIS